MLRDGKATRVFVDGGVVDVREHVISGDDVMLGVRTFPPFGNARRTIDVTHEQFERLLNDRSRAHTHIEYLNGIGKKVQIDRIHATTYHLVKNGKNRSSIS